MVGLEDGGGPRGELVKDFRGKINELIEICET